MIIQADAQAEPWLDLPHHALPSLLVLCTRSILCISFADTRKGKSGIH